MERNCYEEKLKFHIKAALKEIKLTESMRRFQKTIVNNVDMYLTLLVDELKIHFEETWCQCYANDNKMEEDIERDVTFNNLFSIFMIESKTMENRQTVYDIFRGLDFKMDDIIYFLESDIITRFQNVSKEKSEQYTFPFSQNNTPIKDMEQYHGKTTFNYLSEKSL